MKHLGDRITALVDDQLDHDARDLALAHLARCPTCQAAVEAERQVAARLRAMDNLEPPSELMAKLFGLAETGGPLPPPRRPFPGVAPQPVATWRAAPGADTAAARPPHSLRRSALVRYAVAGSVSVGALTVALATLGGSAPESPVVPPTQEFTVEHTRSTGVLPFSDPAAVVVPVGFQEGSEP